MERFRTIGKQFKDYHYSDLRCERKGFLSVFSFAVAESRHRYELVERGHAVVSLPVDFANREVYMVQQPRHILAYAEERGPGRDALEAAKRGGAAPDAFAHEVSEVSIMELAAGVIDPGETAEQAAVRELQEETGFVVPESALEKIADYFPSAGESGLKMHAYFAHLPNPAVSTHTDGAGDESLVIWKMSFEEAWELLDAGQIRTASTQILLRELRYRDAAGKNPKP